MAERLLTVDEVAGCLGISRRTFYRWRMLGIAPATVKLPGGGLRVRADVLAEWLEDREDAA